LVRQTFPVRREWPARSESPTHSTHARPHPTPSIATLRIDNQRNGGFVRIYGLAVQNRVGAIALGLAALAVGGVFLIFGLALLVAVAVVGITLGAGVLLYRRITGRGSLLMDATTRSSRLDPAKEVFPAEDARQSFGALSSHQAEDRNRDKSSE